MGQNKLFDTHAHLDDAQYDEDREAMLARAQAAGVAYIVNIGGSIGSSRRSIKLAEAHPYIYCATGIHPHDASTATPQVLAEIEAMQSHPKCLALGEIGLDYHYDLSPRDIQRDVFRKQMELARRLGRKVIIHSREATEDTLTILREFPTVTGVVHCYSGSLETAKILVDMGYMLSFTGVLTYKNAVKSVEVVEWLPLDKLMAETDAPYLTPVPHRGKRNESAYVSLVLEKMAQIKGLTYGEIARITYENGKQFYGITD